MKFKILLQARQWTRKRSFLRTESKIAWVCTKEAYRYYSERKASSRKRRGKFFPVRPTDRSSLTFFRHSTTLTRWNGRRLLYEKYISWLKFVVECWPSGWSTCRWLALALRRGAGVSLLGRPSNRDRPADAPRLQTSPPCALLLPPSLPGLTSPRPYSRLSLTLCHRHLPVPHLILLHNVFQLHGSRATQDLRSIDPHLQSFPKIRSILNERVK